MNAVLPSFVLPQTVRTLSSARLLRLLPPPTAILLIVAVATVAIITLAHGLADSDYYWHLVTGGLIARTGHVPSADPFSFTYGGQPWTDHEWLGQLVLYETVTSLGASAALLVAGCVAATSLVAPALALRAEGVPVLPLAVGIALGAWIMLSFSTVRPQILSWTLLGILLALLISATSERRRRLLGVPVLFALWVNLHGLWVIGLGVLGVYVFFTLLGHTRLAAAKGWTLGLGLASFVATIANPAGLGGMLYPLRYVQPGNWGLAHISEWMSPNFHDLTFVPLLILLLLFSAVAARRTPAWVTSVGLLGLVLALLAQRNAPVAAVLCLPATTMGLRGLRLQPAGRSF